MNGTDAISPTVFLLGDGSNFARYSSWEEYEQVYDTKESLTAGLEWALRGELADLVAGDRPVARFCVRDGVVRSWLVLPGGKAIDVSRHPAAVELEIAAAARRRLAQEQGWTSAAAARLLRWLTDSGLTIPGVDGVSVSAVLIRAGFPVLRVAAGSGLMVPERLPVWAVEPLRADTSRAALVAALGRRCSRTVVRAFARSLTEGRSGFTVVPLAVVMAAERIGDDRLARIVDVNPNTDAVEFVPGEDSIDVMRSCFGRMRPETVEQISVEALTTANGVKRLVRVAQDLRGIDRHRGALPGSLDELERLILASVPVAPPRRRETRHTRPVTETTPEPRPAPPARELPTAPLNAPSTRVGQSPPERFVYAASVQRLDGHTFGGFRFVLPVRPGELRTWGTVLRNCLPNFVSAVAAGRSVVVGVQHRDVLVAALEIDPVLGRVRQFVGERNRRPPQGLDSRVHAELRTLGVLVPQQITRGHDQISPRGSKPDSHGDSSRRVQRKGKQ